MTVREFFENFNGSEDVQIILHEVGECASLDIRAYQIKRDDEYYKKAPWIVEWKNAEVCDWTVSDTVFNINVIKGD